MAEKKAKAMSKSALFEAVTKEAGNALTKRQVKSVIEANHALATTMEIQGTPCLLYTSPSPRDRTRSRMPSSA